MAPGVLLPDPKLAAVLGATHLLGPGLFEALHLGYDSLTPNVQWCARSTADIEIQVNTILDRLRLGHSLKEQARAALVRIDDRVR